MLHNVQFEHRDNRNDHSGPVDFTQVAENLDKILYKKMFSLHKVIEKC